MLLEQAIPYIQHGITAEMLRYHSDYVGLKYDKIIGIHQWSKDGNHWSLITEGGSKPGLNDIKFNLKNITDLDKYSTTGKTDLDLLDLENKYQFINGRFFCQNYGKYILPTELPFDKVQLLIKLHYDVFNLINNNLANDLKLFG